MAEPLKPIIYVAFANDLDDPKHNLPGLKIEQQNIEDALSASSGSDGPSGVERLTQLLGSWDLEVTANCTPRALTEKFFSNRVAIFHYAGHANPEALLLQTQDGHNIPASSSDIVPFMRNQQTLRLIFLNACSTRQWALDLTGGVDSPFCIIATGCPVQDPLALQFARDFYTSLGNDSTIEKAFQAAMDGARAGLTGTTRDFGKIAHATGGLPWALYPAGPSAAKQWRLSNGVRDPLLGIPPLGEDYPLPASPYVSIQGHQKEDAPIFFGRNAEIRAIYDWGTSATKTPLMLLYGQSGSGKSSLLRAGVWPRLESRATIAYYRRDENLTDDLNFALAIATGFADPNEAAAAWLRSEKPSIILLDQIEEAITRHPGSNSGTGGKQDPNDELRAFFDRLVRIFLDPDSGRPRVPDTKARLILSFRKDYLAEIRNPVAACLPGLMQETWLERLTGNQIVDIVEGPVLREDMRALYKIALEPGFASHLAESLYDPQSPVSTILQLQLKRLWDFWHTQDVDAAKAPEDPEGLAQKELQRCRSAPSPFQRDQGGAALCYSRRLYDTVKADDALVRFLHDQLSAIGDPALGEGLALDLLYEHTTKLGTSQRRTAAELRKFYDGRVQDLDGLVERYKALHLLADPAEESAAQPCQAEVTAETAEGEEASTVLSHDTLAVVVRNEYNLSLQSGPRARRVIENRIRGWDGKKNSDVLEGVELRVVEHGLRHMRKLEQREQDFLYASRMRRRIRRQQWSAVTSCLVLVLGMLGVSLLRAREAASIQRLESLSETNLKSGNELEAILQAMQAADELRHAWLLGGTWNRSLGAPARSHLVDALNGTREVGRYPYNELAEQFPNCAVALNAEDSPRFVSSGARNATLDGKPIPPLQSTSAGRVLIALFGARQQACAGASSTIATATPTGKISLWRSGTTRDVQIPALDLKMPQKLLGIHLSPSGNALAAVFRDSANAPSQIHIADLAAGRLEGSLQTSNVIRSVDFSSDGAMIGEAGDKGATVWAVSTRLPVKTLFDAGNAVQIRFGRGSLGPVAGVILRSSNITGVEVETLHTRDPYGLPMHVAYDYGPAETVRPTPPPPSALAFSADGAVLAVGRDDGRLDFWNVPKSTDLFYGGQLEPDIAAGIGPAGSPVEAVAFSSDGKFAAAVTRPPSPMRVWWVNAAGRKAAATATVSALLGMTCERLRPYLEEPSQARVEPDGFEQIDLGSLARACKSPGSP